MRSIEQTLVRRLLISLCSMFLIFGFVLDYLVGARYEREHDRVIQAKARSLVTLTKYMDKGLELDFADEFMPEFDEDVIEPSYFQIWTHDGELLEKSNSLGNLSLRKPHFGDQPTVAFDVRLPDGRRGRQIGIHFIPQVEDDFFTEEEAIVIADQLSREPVTIVVAEEREKLESALLTLHLTLGAFGILALLSTVFLVRKVVRQGLTPLRNLQHQVAQLDTNSLEKRLVPDDSVMELDKITDQFNQLLGRIERGFLREKQFSSDVAHELRTPVAEIKALSEVAIRWPEDPVVNDRFYRDTLAASIQMESTINNLLALARSESTVAVDCVDKVDLTHETSLCTKKHSDGSTGTINKDIVINSKGVVVVFTVASYLKLIIENILQNAISHGTRNRPICVDIVSSDGNFTLSVSNSTEALAETDLQFIFDRMWRKDKVRRDQGAGVTSHSGIGLSLVRNYCDLLGYEAKAVLNDGMFTLSVSGPDRVRSSRIPPDS